MHTQPATASFVLLASALLTACGARSPLGIKQPAPDSGVIDAAVDTAPACKAASAPCEDGSECCDGVCTDGLCGRDECVPGEPMQEIATPTITPLSLAFDADYVYWTDGVEVQRVRRRGGEVTTPATLGGLGDGGG